MSNDNVFHSVLCGYLPSVKAFSPQPSNLSAQISHYFYVNLYRLRPTKGFDMNIELVAYVRELMNHLNIYELRDHADAFFKCLIAPESAREPWLYKTWIPEAERLIAEAQQPPEPMDWSEHKEYLNDE